MGAGNRSSATPSRLNKLTQAAVDSVNEAVSEIDSGPVTAPDVVTPNAGDAVAEAVHGDGDPPVSFDTPVAAELAKAWVALEDASERTPPTCRASATETSSRAATAGKTLRRRYAVWKTADAG